ncbi:MAG: recombination mediator RecR [Chitinophagales bacterium]|nr:recombination mediator RecR [Chitinophagales bacterium]
MADDEICGICSNSSRDKSVICVVEDVRDVMALENTGMFKGVYHVLGGKISPIEGVGPSQLKITSLVDKVKSGNISEIIFALSSTMEGDTTIYYISKLLQDKEVKVSTISRGVSFGGELEYTDELTLARSISGRIPYENYLVK